MSFKLRDYQEKAVENALKDMKTKQKIGLILPTGAGKTEIFIKIAEEFIKQNPKECVLILSHLSLLTQQTADRFKLRAPHIKVGTFQGIETPSFNAQVVIGTMQTSSKVDKANRLKLKLVKPVGLVIIDEAHYLTCNSYDSALEQFANAQQIGCTASPFRYGALMTNYFDTISFSISLQELITNKHLVPPMLVEIEDDSKEPEQKMALIAAIYKEKELGKAAIVFMKSIEDAEQMRNVFEDNGIKSHAITSELPAEQREKIFKEFREGKVKVLTTVNVLTAGFDSKNIEAIFMPYPTNSPVIYLQRIGRGLRPDDSIGKTHCNIYVCGDSPSIKRGDFKRLHNNVLEINSKKKKNTTFEEDFTILNKEEKDEVYQWSRTVVETIRLMRDLKFETLAKLLNSKKFPKRFLNDIAHFHEGMQGNETKLMDVSAPTKSKIATLKSLGYTADVYNKVNSSEASALIAAALNVKKNCWAQRPNVAISGIHAGKPLEQLPKMYLLQVKRYLTNTAIGEQIKTFEKEGGKYLFAKKMQ